MICGVGQAMVLASSKRLSMRPIWAELTGRTFRHEVALALAVGEQPFVGQDAQRFADRDPAGVQLLSQLLLAQLLGLSQPWISQVIHPGRTFPGRGS